MPFRKNAVRTAAHSLIGGTFIITTLLYTWKHTRSPGWTLITAAAAVAVLKALETQRAHRRRTLPVHIRYPGSTAV